MVALYPPMARMVTRPNWKMIEYNESMSVFNKSGENVFQASVSYTDEGELIIRDKPASQTSSVP